MNKLSIIQDEHNNKFDDTKQIFEKCASAGNFKYGKRGGYYGQECKYYCRS